MIASVIMVYLLCFIILKILNLRFFPPSVSTVQEKKVLIKKQNLNQWPVDVKIESEWIMNESEWNRMNYTPECDLYLMEIWWNSFLVLELFFWWLEYALNWEIWKIFKFGGSRENLGVPMGSGFSVGFFLSNS